jgi:hypothetical protein
VGDKYGLVLYVSPAGKVTKFTVTVTVDDTKGTLRRLPDPGHSAEMIGAKESAERALTGDVAAIAEARRIIEARIRLLGLPGRASHDDEGCRTLVCSCPPRTGHRSATTTSP